MSAGSRQPLSDRDLVGTDYANLEAAKRDALLRIRALLNQEAGWGNSNLSRYVEITDEAGNVLAIIPFSEAAGL